MRQILLFVLQTLLAPCGSILTSGTALLDGHRVARCGLSVGIMDNVQEARELIRKIRCELGIVEESGELTRSGRTCEKTLRMCVTFTAIHESTTDLSQSIRGAVQYANALHFGACPECRRQQVSRRCPSPPHSCLSHGRATVGRVQRDWIH